jgi:D-3-phosphoglycerate dehydrogenase / 2-oxoglutarate reductase
LYKRINLKITDHVEKDLKWEEEECNKLGIDFACYQMKDASAEEIIDTFKDADILINNAVPMTATILRGLKNVKLLLRHGIGYDKVDVNAASENGIVFANQATAYCQDVAEHTIMLMFETIRMKNRQDKMMQLWMKTKNRSFDHTLQVRRIKDKTLGIVGCGNIGSRVLEMVKGFCMRVLVCDPYLTPERYHELGIKHVPLDSLLAESDIVTLHVPLTEETRGMFNYEIFKQMKQSAVIINAARGPVIKSKDLLRALMDDIIAGAGLDVFETEPPEAGADIKLLEMENVITSPHFAWYSEEGGWNIRYHIMDDVRSFLNGYPPKSVVNPEVFDRPQLKISFKIRKSALQNL